MTVTCYRQQHYDALAMVMLLPDLLRDGSAENSLEIQQSGHGPRSEREGIWTVDTCSKKRFCALGLGLKVWVQVKFRLQVNLQIKLIFV